MAESSSDPNCCDADATLEYQEFLVDYNKAMARALPGVVSFEQRISIRGAFTKRNCEPTYSVKEITHRLTGQTIITVHCDRLWAHIEANTFDNRNDHLKEFSEIASKIPALRELKPALRNCYELLEAFGYSDLDLRQLGTFGYLKTTDLENESASPVFSVPKKLRGLIFDTHRHATSYAIENYYGEDGVLPEFQDDTLRITNIGSFSYFLSFFPEESPEHLLFDLWEYIESCTRSIMNEQTKDVIGELVQIGIISERLSWKLLHELDAEKGKDFAPKTGKATRTRTENATTRRQKIRTILRRIGKENYPTKTASGAVNVSALVDSILDHELAKSGEFPVKSKRTIKDDVKKILDL